MTLTPGARLNEYEVTAPLGAGGMGEVYRARDTRLGRDVAIKVLPSDFAESPERSTRFQREARVLAGLNHPNVATLYGFERDGEIRFLAMELVEGEDLATRLAHGPLPVEECLELFSQVAEGLEAAHEQGIVHRDLKPANLMVDREGRVRILDFGLAKALEPPPETDTDLADSPTLTAAATRRGEIMGTAAYMSPEQATGRPVNERADIWAFGVCLYEALTGSSPFRAGDSVESLAWVLEREPEWERLPPSVPASVEAFLRRCLHKDPRQRVRHIGDVKLALRGAFEPIDAGGGGDSGSGSRAPWQRPAAVGALVVLAALVGALLASRLGRDTGTSGSTNRFRISVDDAGAVYDQYFGVALSRDGRNLVYQGSTQLRLRSLDTLESRPIPGTEGGGNPFFSPDGTRIGFNVGSALRTVPLRGGSVVTVCECTTAGASWGPDGTIVFGSATGLYRVAAEGGEPEILTRSAEGDQHLTPRWLPRGRGILFTISSRSAPVPGRSVAPPTSQLAVLSLADDTVRHLAPGRGVAYGGGHVVFGRASSLWAAPFDEERLVLTGEPFVVADDVDVTNLVRMPRFDVAADGTLMYLTTSASRFSSELVWIDRAGIETPLGVDIATMGDYFYVPRISPDGRSVVADVNDGGNRDVWTIDLGDMTPTRRTFDTRNDAYPIWTPDGRRLIWARGAGGGRHLVWQSADGTGTPEQLTDGPNNQLPFDVTADGRTLVLTETDPGGNSNEIGILPLDGSRETRLIVQAPGGQFNPDLSPDGRWLVYESGDRLYVPFGVGDAQVIVRPFPDTASGRWQISQEGGRWPVWGPDGRELFYRSAEGIMRVELATGSTFRHLRPELLIPLAEAYFPFGPGRSFDITPDGRRFLIVKAPDGMLDPADMEAPLVVVQNWLGAQPASGN